MSVSIIYGPAMRLNTFFRFSDDLRASIGEICGRFVTTIRPIAWCQNSDGAGHIWNCLEGATLQDVTDNE